MATTSTFGPSPGPARVSTPRPTRHARTSSIQSQTPLASKSSSRQPPGSGLGCKTSTDSGSSGSSGSGTQQSSGSSSSAQRRSTRASTTGGDRTAAIAAGADPLSDKATVFLIRRILCLGDNGKGSGGTTGGSGGGGLSSAQALEEILPPLTSRNDVDLQLYALIAIILRDFVQSWYHKITPDETFVGEIVQLIAHITRALEQRLRKVDLESLVFDEIPELLERHITAYRTAHDPITQPPVRTEPREVYHSLWPLPALSPVPRTQLGDDEDTDPDTISIARQQAENEATYRQLLVYAVLAILLPTEDLENSVLTTLVGQILSELVIGNLVANKLSEPWMIFELLIIAARNARKGVTAEFGEKESASGASLSTSSKKRRRSAAAAVEATGGTTGGGKRFSIQGLFWSIVQWCFLTMSFFRGLWTLLTMAKTLPPRTSTQRAEKLKNYEPSKPADPHKQAPKTPVLAFRCWSAILRLVELDFRMPWLHGILSMLQWAAITGPGEVGAVDGKLDRLLSHLLCTSALDPAKLPSILRAARAALFPGNMPAGPSSLVPPASEAEYRRLRRRCARAVYRAIAPGPGAVRSVVKTFFLGGFGFGSRSQQKNDQKKSSQHQPGRKAQGKGNDNHNKPRGRATKWEGSASTPATSSFTSSSSSTGVGEVGLGPAAWLKNGGPKKDKDRDKTKARDDKKGNNIGSSPSPSTLSSLPAKDQHQQQQRSAPGPVGLAAVSSAFPPASFPSSTTTPITSASNVAVDADASSSLLPRPAVSASAGTNTSLCASRTNNGADDDRRNGKRRLIHKPASHSQAYYYYDINRWNDCGEDEDHYVYYDDIDSDEEWDEDEQAVLREIDRSVLDVFSDAYCNKHLIYGILELVLVRLIPELAERGVGELWAERIPDVVHPV